jgi:CheY-like chemotaxis protein
MHAGIIFQKSQREVNDMKEQEKIEAYLSSVRHDLRSQIMVVREGASIILDNIVGSNCDNCFSLLRPALESANELNKLIGEFLSTPQFIKMLTPLITEKEEEIKNIEKLLHEKEEALLNAKREVLKNQEELEKIKKQLLGKEEEMRNKEKLLRVKEEELMNAKREGLKNQEELEKVKKQLLGKEEEMKNREKIVRTKEEELMKAQENGLKNQEELEKIKEQLLGKEEELRSVKRELMRKEEELKIVKRELPGKTEELKSSKEEPLSQELEILTYELMGMISHVIRTPLAVVKESLALVLDEVPGGLNEKQKELLSNGKKNLDNLIQSVEELSQESWDEIVCSLRQQFSIDVLIQKERKEKLPQKKRILIVEDQSVISSMLKMRLEANNYEVITAGDGEEGLEKARKENPSLIILDIMLPKMNGYKVCQLLKADPNYKTIPIIISSGRTPQEIRKVGKEMGADAFVSKPFEAEELLSKMKELLEKKKK